MRKLWWWGLMLGSVSAAAWASEPVHGCFATAAEAAAGVVSHSAVVATAAEPEGYRLESLRHDPMLGRSWAVIRRCGHPERPALVVELLHEAAHTAAVEAPAVESPAVPRSAALVSLQALPASLATERGRSRAREASAGTAEIRLLVAAPAHTAAPLAKVEALKPVLMAGARVEVVRVEQNVRLTLLAIAERSATLGERVRLRVVRESGESEQFVEGVVRGAELVEMEAGR